MSEELQQKLRDQLWEVANRLRGNMSASDFMYFIPFFSGTFPQENPAENISDRIGMDRI